MVQSSFQMRILDAPLPSLFIKFRNFSVTKLVNIENYKHIYFRKFATEILFIRSLFLMSHFINLVPCKISREEISFHYPSGTFAICKTPDISLNFTLIWTRTKHCRLPIPNIWTSFLSLTFA